MTQVRAHVGFRTSNAEGEVQRPIARAAVGPRHVLRFFEQVATYRPAAERARRGTLSAPIVSSDAARPSPSTRYAAGVPTPGEDLHVSTPIPEQHPRLQAVFLEQRAVLVRIAERDEHQLHAARAELGLQRGQLRRDRGAEPAPRTPVHQEHLAARQVGDRDLVAVGIRQLERRDRLSHAHAGRPGERGLGGLLVRDPFEQPGAPDLPA